MDDTAKHTLHAWWRSSPLAVSNAPYLEALYETFLRDPSGIDPVWQRYFETLPGAASGAPDISHEEIREQFRQLARARRTSPRAPEPAAAPDVAQKQVRVLQLINAYRFRGHQFASLDPLGLREKQPLGELDLRYHGLSDLDLDLRFDTGSLVGARRAPLRDILAQLQSTYCGSIGAEYMHITDTAEKRWLQSALESVHGVPPYPAETRRRLLERLTAAEGLEHYLHAKYVGQKRFSLEGGESLIPMLDELIQRAGDSGVKEIVVGMAHRGRLNVLVNILGKTPAELFLEFEGKARSAAGTGDVKYHKGFSSDIDTPGGPVHLALAFNPSHLEIVGPVVQGSVRARQERRHDKRGVRVLPVVIHGDAAFAGQGVVMETFNLSQLRGYRTGGTVHIVINNQIGFTTSLTQDARSTLYCTDVARMLNAPILHVNGDDPEAVLFATEIALDYRSNFRKDVVLDLVCYRRHGHSEADEPTVTQPTMYQRIRELPTTRARYARHLTETGVVTSEESDAMAKQFRDRLDAGDAVAPNLTPKGKSGYAYGTDWSRFAREATEDADTAVALETLRALTERLLLLPDGFEPHPSVAKVNDARRKMAAGALPIDWGYAETLAYATLLRQGYGVRLSGQDTGRGTFFHRHAILHSRKDGEVFVPLRNLFEGQPDFRAINSPLTEEACLAFEYGYSTADPGTLVIWEAQFGDFANNAQVVIDQFISAGEQKWGRLCGLTLLLPHGLEGQGPEHSSARLERYLQLCAQQNMFVCSPTTPAQFFHLLRRQMLARTRKPLVVMTPKSLLRHRLAVSSLEDLTGGGFQTIVPEGDALDPGSVTDVVMCSGKVYYDLVEQRRERGATHAAILRIEQLYPFPEALLATELGHYPRARRFVWCQEEHKNQGAWYPSQHHIWRVLPPGARLEYAGRPTSAAPAVGDYKLHLQELRELANNALGLEGDKGKTA
ncbi:MAG: 2-oxoglutarate dehydrogenase [Acidithiobacillales bacterium SM1_46]|nr:MAG: 2-oxoglutarate dehydrogenase [Acidithiobacillales bacterium SM1_46]